MEYNKPLYDEVKRGEIYYIGVDDEHESIGSEQYNHDRPGIIVSNDVGNIHSGIVEVVYLTTAPKKSLPTHVEIYTTTKPSTALCEQICTVSKFRLRKYVNQCSEREMEDIDNALIISLQLSKAKGVGKYMEKWDKMIKEGVTSVTEEPTIEAEPVEPVCTGEGVEDEVVETQYINYDTYMAQKEAELEVYKKCYEDMHELLKMCIGGK